MIQVFDFTELGKLKIIGKMKKSTVNRFEPWVENDHQPPLIYLTLDVSGIKLLEQFLALEYGDDARKIHQAFVFNECQKEGIQITVQGNSVDGYYFTTLEPKKEQLRNQVLEIIKEELRVELEARSRGLRDDGHEVIVKVYLQGSYTDPICEDSIIL